MKIQTAYGLVNVSDIIPNPLTSVYNYTTTKGLIATNWIWRGYFEVAAGSIVRMRYKGFNITMQYYKDEYHMECTGTYFNGIKMSNYPKIESRARKHMLFLINHFDSERIKAIRDYQITQPLFFIKNN